MGETTENSQNLHETQELQETQNLHETEPCMEIFLECIKSDSAKKSYGDAMRYFKDFIEFQKFQDILDLDPKKLTQLIVSYIIFRKNNNNPNSMGFYYHPIQTFLEMNDVLLNFKKLRRLFPARIKTTVERGWTTEEIKKMLDVCSNSKQRAIIHFENASGGRIGIFNGLKIRHLIVIDDPDVGKCYGIIGYADEVEEYTTFLTPESTKALDDYLDKRRSDHEVINNDSPVFRANYCIGSTNIISSTSKNLGSIPAYLQKKAGLRDVSTKKWGRFPIQRNHGFRHRFDEVIKSVAGINTHLAEKMFAHTSRLVPLDGTYHTPKIENSFKEYKKIIPLLTIDQTEAQKIKIKEKDNMISKLQDTQKQLDEMKIKQKEMERLVYIEKKFPDIDNQT